jgi:hypothetical protein
MLFILVVAYVLSWRLYRGLFLERDGKSPFTQSDHQWRHERIAAIVLTAAMAAAAWLWCVRWQACLALIWMFLVAGAEFRELWRARKNRIFNRSDDNHGPLLPPATAPRKTARLSTVLP